jgi:hypothetical protein
MRLQALRAWQGWLLGPPSHTRDAFAGGGGQCAAPRQAQGAALAHLVDRRVNLRQKVGHAGRQARELQHLLHQGLYLPAPGIVGAAHGPGAGGVGILVGPGSCGAGCGLRRAAILLLHGGRGRCLRMHCRAPGLPAAPGGCNRHAPCRRCCASRSPRRAAGAGRQLIEVPAHKHGVAMGGQRPRHCCSNGWMRGRRWAG